MTRQPRVAVNDVPNLRSFAVHVAQEAERMLAGVPLSHPDGSQELDDLCFMAACVVSREIGHLRAVALLVDADLHNEALILGRSMLEGMVQLLWAAQEPHVRPRRWRAYSLVEDWRVAERADRTETPVDDAERDSLISRLQSDGKQFFTRRAKNAVAAGHPVPPNPYQKNWFGGSSIKSLFEQAAGNDLWPLYEQASLNVHWTPRGLGSSLTRQDGIVSYSPVDSSEAATALASGIQAVLQTSKLLSGCLASDVTERVDSLIDDYIAMMSGHGRNEGAE